MKKKINLVTIVLFIIFISSCSFHVYQSNLQIKKGMHVAEVIKIIDDDTFVSSYIQEGPHDLTRMGLTEFGNVELLIRKRFHATGKEIYMYAFLDDKLIYWGYPIEFSRSNNKLLFAIGKKAIEIIEKEKNS